MAGVGQTGAMRTAVRTVRLGVAVGSLGLLAGGCGDDVADRAATTTAAPDASDASDARAMLSSEVVVDGLNGPTQIAPDGRGGYVVAELNGGEAEGRAGCSRSRRWTRRPRSWSTDSSHRPASPSTATCSGSWSADAHRRPARRSDRPHDRARSNSRSTDAREGTISSVEGGGILYDTSGSRLGEPASSWTGSGTLWYLAWPRRRARAVRDRFQARVRPHPARRRAVAWSPRCPTGASTVRSRRTSSSSRARATTSAIRGASVTGRPVGETGGTDADCASRRHRRSALFQPSATPTAWPSPRGTRTPSSSPCGTAARSSPCRPAGG